MISIQYLKTWILFKLENDFALTLVQDSLALMEPAPGGRSVSERLSFRVDLLVLVLLSKIL